MFTGIVHGARPVVSVERGGGLATLRVDLGQYADGLEAGASVALNGTCVTAAAVDAGVARFEIVKETSEGTNLGQLQAGDQVNCERSLRFGDEVGGHVLSGHVACMAEIATVEAGAGHRRIAVEVPARWMRYLMPKGFVALNGASLTIQDLDREHRAFAVSLIPETLARTTFGALSAGDLLNLEVDARTQAIVDATAALLPDLLRQERMQAKTR